MFTSIRTARLLLRPLHSGDTAELALRRNDPQVARYQGYALPFTMEQAGAMTAEVAAMAGPEEGKWWLALICDRATGETLGDLAVRLSWQGRTAEVGYTLAPRHWGRGYATEALGALLAHLFGEARVTRAFGMLHPENTASAAVLERCGFLFEGHTRSSYWVGDDCSDDWIYGLTSPDWEAWGRRPRHPAGEVTLAEVTAANETEVSAIRLHHSQEPFAGPVSRQFAAALCPPAAEGAPLVPRLRALVADGEVVGLVLLLTNTAGPPVPFLRALLIDRRHQRRGIGGRALEMIAGEWRTRGARTLATSWPEGRGAPGPFFTAHGFRPTGRVLDGRTEARRDLV